MAKQYILKRDVTPEECHWLDKTISKGEVVYFYESATHKTIGATGLAFTFTSGVTPFFELPINAVRFFGEQINEEDKIDLWLSTGKN